MDLPITWKSWENVRNQKVVEISGSLSAAVAALEKSLKLFKIHYFVKHVQEREFENEKANISHPKAVLKDDFAENYSYISQDEIQSPHWGHNQVAVFTAVAWIEDQCHSFAIIIDNLSHDKLCAFVFIKKLLSSYLQIIPH
ncbi:unnamed protein product [Brassicogethes aeneus]|uniref:Uncharacterized protein n=1 Tax=Brassicogethes aeneus TaxID=1431903 RepID=A0A9P0B873_BRAAE|nr:unnamed protein product [Brassicogethes aeneus]